MWFCGMLIRGARCGVQEALLELGADQVVIRQMQTYPGDQQVQKEGCWALYALGGRMSPWRRWQVG